jgi:serine/threonine protein kinase
MEIAKNFFLGKMVRQPGIIPNPGATPDGGKEVPCTFTFGTEIARGGMGVVYKATQKTTDEPFFEKQVAIKCFQLASSGLALEKQQKSITKERKFLETVRQQGIAGIPALIGFWEETVENQNYSFLAQELIEGADLGKIIESLQTQKIILPVIERHLLCRQLATIVQSIHGLGLIHADLKPANVLIKLVNQESLVLKIQAENIWVIDFGLILRDPEKGQKEVNFTVSLGGDDRLVGTPGFFAPEIMLIENQSGQVRYTPQSDVFALGITFHLLLTDGQNPLRISTANFLEPYTRIEQAQLPALEGRYPPEVKKIIAGMLRLNAQDRVSLEEVVSEFSSLIEIEEAKTQGGSCLGCFITFLGAILIVAGMCGIAYLGFLFFEDRAQFDRKIGLIQVFCQNAYTILRSWVDNKK